MPNVDIHAQPLHQKHLDLLLHGSVGIRTQQAVVDARAQQTAPTGQPEQYQVELGAREQLDGDVEEAGVASAQGQCVAGEAMLRDVSEGGGEDGGLRVGVFVDGGVGVVLRVVGAERRGAIEGSKARLVAGGR